MVLPTPHPVVLAITGASGAIYAVRLLDVLLAAGQDVRLTISPAAARVFAEELGLELHLDRFELAQILPAPEKSPTVLREWLSQARPLPVTGPRGTVIYYPHHDYAAAIASGSHQTSGMVICPCSMGTLGAIASGLSTNLVHRAAEVHLKERRKLILMPRETPLGKIALQNMERLTEAGAVILPAMPGFYHAPRSIMDLVDFVVTRICDQLGVRVELTKRWGTSP